MFKRTGSILIVFLIFALPLDAKSLLYQVSSPSSTVYILGSIHLAKPELYPLRSVIEESYNKSDVLVVEVDAESSESMIAMQNAMKTLGTYPKGRTLRSELSETTYRALRSFTRKRGIPLETLEPMRPWVVMMQLSMTEMLRLGYAPELGIDKHFLDRAKVERKAIVALETIEEQMTLLSREDRAYQEKLLRYTLASMDEMETMLNRLFTSWKNGDAEAMEKMFLLPMQNDADLKDIYDDLVTRRNYKMAEKIMAYLGSDRDYFVVVGAGHVVGKKGIVDLLATQGYDVLQK
ncbi:TraB/GumN family protein [Sulfurimonas sp. HSL3-7]|uniref:TraB/GumN family protein n=1 Tax=Sulfonitrofixus jiaomeiensis TaxID=3131938 RepID=UPI0031F7ED3E